MIDLKYNIFINFDFVLQRNAAKKKLKNLIYYTIIRESVLKFLCLKFVNIVEAMDLGKTEISKTFSP